MASSTSQPRRRLRSRTRDLVERRITLVRLLIAIFVARIAVTILEVGESSVSPWGALITLAIAVEAWRAWTVARVARRGGVRQARVADSLWDRLLRPLERSGPAIVYALTAAFAVAVILLLLLGEPHGTLLDIALIGREVTTFFFLGVILAGYMSVRRAPAAAGSDEARPPSP